MFFIEINLFSCYTVQSSITYPFLISLPPEYEKGILFNHSHQPSGQSKVSPTVYSKSRPIA